MQGKNYRRLVWVTTLLLLSTIVRAQQERFVFTTAWMAQAQFAGYYVAYERGFYKEAGLDVDIQHPTLTSSALTRLKSQQCHATMFSLLSAMDFISQGFSLVNIFQESMNSSNMRSYVLGTGYDRLVWKADYTSDEQSTCQWGVRDDIMFNTLLADIQKEQTDKPWMKTLLTLSSHEPWDVPTKVLDDEVYNAFNYLDQCIGRFIDDLQKTPAWRNTLVVILPDHGYRYKGIDEATHLYNHIPMIWVGGAVRLPVVIDRLCNQSDLAATLLGQLGIRHDDFRFSRV